MEKIVLDNGVRLLYEYRSADITSFCIGFEAGANMEQGFNLGTAHALEHMLFKGTSELTEDEINLRSDRLFGFNNAMTNFPYCIYYGTTANEDFVEAFSLYSDIIINPALSEVGFKEEMDVILQECKEWKEDFEQYCEDEILFNSYGRKRVKEIIIGTEESIRNITLAELKRFYNKYYVPKNCVISVVSNIPLKEIIDVVEARFKEFKGTYTEVIFDNEDIKEGTYYKEIDGFEGAKLQYIFDISMLNHKEVEALRVFNTWFGEGVSSRLFDEVRTKNGLAYEVSSLIKNEKGIKLFSINCSTSKVNVEKTINIIDDLINTAAKNFEKLSEKDMAFLIKRLKLKRSLELERSIVLANRLTIYEIMYGDGDLVNAELKFKYKLEVKDIIEVITKVLAKGSKQVLW
ncbi:M16 family metallopeptidase [Clostridium manihotivorum]|uniref:Insulinase family protein n=1 Tax=Clostridium manihotivorum TaxID=2320868 RepID=A0A410DRE3_9CLOT|nr:pitrilysin family protein [Clostridium manihotivorum]QAA31621.1 insulinase family protein [Clostridium manihotivorum]